MVPPVMSLHESKITEIKAVIEPFENADQSMRMVKLLEERAIGKVQMSPVKKAQITWHDLNQAGQVAWVPCQ